MHGRYQACEYLNGTNRQCKVGRHLLEFCCGNPTIVRQHGRQVQATALRPVSCAAASHRTHAPSLKRLDYDGRTPQRRTSMYIALVLCLYASTRHQLHGHLHPHMVITVTHFLAIADRVVGGRVRSRGLVDVQSAAKLQSNRLLLRSLSRFLSCTVIGGGTARILRT
jgi:hypothetical protein